ncbi:MAG: type IIL restriction-modification enzyme MmeI, partial [Prevotella sp.]
SRFMKVAEIRKKSPKKQTVEKANRPWAFSENRYNDSSSIIIPAVSSEKRKYIPIGFVEPHTVIYHSAFAIYNGDAFTFGIVESYLHMVWVKNVCGKLETRIRYSAQLCYNTFPFPKISAAKKREIADAAEDILVTREFHVGKTLAELYDPDKMPKDLLEAHEKLDDIVESCYPGYPFANDEARLECLFRMYEKMTSKKQ